MKVVVVDDDPMVLVVIEKLLTHRGHTVLAYASAMECPLYTGPCPCAASNPCPDVVISDFNMPEVNGAQFLQALKDRGCHCAHLAIISGQSVPKEAMSQLNKYGTRFFLKPMDMDELYAWLDRIPQPAPITSTESLMMPA